MRDRIEAPEERTAAPDMPPASGAEVSSAAGATGAPGAPAPRMFLTAHEVGEQLGVRKSRVYELAAAGLLPVVRLGRRMLFPRRGLEQLAQAAIERAMALPAPERHAPPVPKRSPTHAAASQTSGGRSRAA